MEGVDVCYQGELKLLSVGILSLRWNLCVVQGYGLHSLLDIVNVYRLRLTKTNLMHCLCLGDVPCCLSSSKLTNTFIATNQKSESPVVVVLSGSMEPAFQRGDILFLNNSVKKVYVGDVVVFKIKDRDIPIVHRILKVHEKPDGKVELLTKGDNNRVDDRGLYAPGQLWLEREDILGKAVGTLRYVGMVTIALNDYPVLKYVLVGMMGLFVLTSKEG